MTMSTGASPTSAANALTEAVSATLSFSTHSLPGCWSPSAVSSVAAEGSRTPAITLAPSARYWRANSRPMPRFAPEISTVVMDQSSSSWARPARGGAMGGGWGAGTTPSCASASAGPDR